LSRALAQLCGTQSPNYFYSKTNSNSSQITFILIEGCFNWSVRYFDQLPRLFLINTFAYGDGNNDLTSNGNLFKDGYIAKFDSGGNFVWAKNIGGSGSDRTYSITTDSSDNVFVGGNFSGQIDIDGDGIYDLNSYFDGYVAKFDTHGNFVWAKNIGGKNGDYAESITTDSSGNVLVVGRFNGQIDIDGDGNNDLTSHGSLFKDGYVAKFDSDGDFVWAKNIDERKFGIQVVGNYFRDLRGLYSLGPLGLRMLAKGKFPLTFESSEGTETVRSLIESFKSLDFVTNH
jgi:hypothetical protein